MRRTVLVLVGFGVLAAAAIAAASTGGLPNNPPWEEIWVTWKKGVKPVLLGRDDQINTLEKKGELTETDAHVVLDAPVLDVGKGG